MSVYPANPINRKKLTNGSFSLSEAKKEMAKAQTQQLKNRIRIRLKGYDHRALDASCDQIVDSANRTGAEVTGPIYLPTDRHIYCVNRSPHVDKKSREHFEIRVHKRLIDIESPTNETTDALTRLDLPAGVDIELKL